MKKRKRFLSILLILLLFALMTTGCGSSGGNPAFGGGQIDDGNLLTEESNSQTADDNSQAADDSSQAEGGGAAVSETPTGPAPSYVLDHQVLVDDERCTFTIVNVEYDSIDGIVFNVFLENKTPDSTLWFKMEDFYINGYMVFLMWAENVPAGETKYSSFSLSPSDLDEFGITYAEEVVMNLVIYDRDNYEFNDLAGEVFTVYPTGLSAEEVVYPERRTSSSEKVILDNDQLTFVILDTTYDDLSRYTLNCYIENKSDISLMVSWEDVSVNGIQIEPFAVEIVFSGKRAYTQFYFTPSSLKACGITEVENIQFTLCAHDANFMFSDDYIHGDIIRETFVYEP